MKKYVFFTNSMGGFSGGPTYVRNKTKFLRENGWQVIVFDTTGDLNSKIEMELLKEFEANRYKELYYYPQLLRKPRRERVIRQIIEKIGKCEDIVIESDSLTTSVWGEIIAQRIRAKHIIYVLSENPSVGEKTMYEFYKFKANREELFAINPNAYKKLMGGFEKIDDAEDYYWSARIFVPIEDVACNELSTMEKAKYNIGHFGRYKGYFKYMFQNVAAFANKHHDDVISFVLLGVDSLSKELQDLLPENTRLKLISSRQPIPKKFYDLCDVVIATAGCVAISYWHGAKVVAMDVHNNNPLGVFGYDTRDSNIRSDDNSYSLSLCETLENVLVQKKYEGEPVLEIPISNKGYDYQIQFATNSDGNFYDMDKVIVNRKGKTPFLLKLDMIGLCSKYRYFTHHRSLR